MEYEKRVMLDDKQYFALISYYLRKNPHFPFIDQTNYYFDTPDLSLKKEHKVLRARVIVHKGSELTLKIKEEKGDKEISQKLSYLSLRALLKKNKFPKGEVLNNLLEQNKPVSSYKNICSLRTLRLEIKEEDYLVVIDKNEYNDITDFNLEIESTSRERALEVINKFCEQYNIEYKKDYRSKSTRVFESLK